MIYLLRESIKKCRQALQNVTRPELRKLTCCNGRRFLGSFCLSLIEQCMDGDKKSSSLLCLCLVPGSLGNNCHCTGSSIKVSDQGQVVLKRKSQPLPNDCHGFARRGEVRERRNRIKGLDGKQLTIHCKKALRPNILTCKYYG